MTEALFSAVELGNAPRSDHPDFAFANAEGVEKVGIRSVIGVGPSRPPYPRDYTYWKDGRRVDRTVTFEESLAAAVAGATK